MCAMSIEPGPAALGNPEQGLFFRFESDFVSSLRCIPMVVRFKLDLCGVKLSLRAWSQFDHATRARCVGLPTRSEEEVRGYGEALCQALEAIGQKPVRLAIDAAPAWADVRSAPAAVLARGLAEGIAAERFAGWGALAPLQRFALVKLTRGGHENANFLPALLEFGL